MINEAVERFAYIPRLVSGWCTINVFALLALISVALYNFFFLALLANVTGAERNPVAESKAKPPEWPYGTGPAEAPRPASLNSSGENTASENSPQHLPGSTLVFTRKEANDPFNPADWYPADHPMDASPPAFGSAISVSFQMEKGKPENAACAPQNCDQVVESGEWP